MAKVVKGTWRFNDVLTLLYNSDESFDYTYTYEGRVVEGTAMSLDFYGGIVTFIYKGIDDTYQGTDYVYYVDTGWTHPDYQIITFTSEQEVSDEFYTWFAANATRIDEEEIPIATITYKGETLETLNGGEYITLHTKGQMMEDDIRVEVAEASGGDISINGIVEQYKVNAGATVNAGDFVEFVNKFGGGTFTDASPGTVHAVKLDNNRVLVAYSVNAVVLTIGTEGVTVGTSVAIAFTPSDITALSGNKVLIASYSKNTSIDVQLLLIDEAEIIAGDRVDLANTAINGSLSITALSDSKVLATYEKYNYTSEMGCCVLTIDGKTITQHSAVYTKLKFSRGVDLTKVVRLTEGKAIIIAEVPDACYAWIATINQTTVTLGSYTSKSYSLWSAGWMDAVALSENKVVAVFGTNWSEDTAKAVVLTVTDTSISIGNPCDLGVKTYTHIDALTDNSVLFTYQSASYGRALILSIDGTTITAGTGKVFDYNTVTYPNVIAFSPTSALAIYNNGMGAYASLSIDGNSITADSAEIGTYVQPATSRLHNVGVAKTSGTEGQMVDVYCV